MISHSRGAGRFFSVEESRKKLMTTPLHGVEDFSVGSQREPMSHVSALGEVLPVLRWCGTDDRTVSSYGKILPIGFSYIIARLCRARDFFPVAWEADDYIFDL